MSAPAATVSVTISDVVWTDLVGVSVTGNTITKTVATGWGNAGAAGITPITANGNVNFRADEINTHRILGLSSTNSGTSWQSIDHGLYLVADSRVQIYEKGVYRGTYGNYAIDDRFSIERVGSTIYYKKNNSIFYTSGQSSSGNLIVDATIYHQGGRVSDMVITNAP